MIPFIVGFFVGGFTCLTLYALVLVGSEEEDEKRIRK